MLEKWKRAVIHLECATNSEHYYDYIKRIEEQTANLVEGHITQEQFAEEMSRGFRDIRFHGTALFLTHAGYHYLLTARHVVWDKQSAERELNEEVERIRDWPEPMQHTMLQYAIERAQQRIFNIVFRVPSLEEILNKYEMQEFLMNLGAGADFTVPYTFSTPELDLALISLDQRDSRFAEELNLRGYVPIALDDIAEGPEAEGQEVFTIGFPSSTALIGQVSQHPKFKFWSSNYFSLPVTSFGRVSMLHEALQFFWVDLSVFPGNSGGPVVANNRLVGIVSAQAVLPIDDAPHIQTRIPFGRIIKTSAVRALLEEQEKKDNS